MIHLPGTTRQGKEMTVARGEENIKPFVVEYDQKIWTFPDDISWFWPGSSDQTGVNSSQIYSTQRSKNPSSTEFVLKNAVLNFALRPPFEKTIFPSMPPWVLYSVR